MSNTIESRLEAYESRHVNRWGPAAYLAHYARELEARSPGAMLEARRVTLDADAGAINIIPALIAGDTVSLGRVA